MHADDAISLFVLQPKGLRIIAKILTINLINNTVISLKQFLKLTKICVAVEFQSTRPATVFYHRCLADQMQYIHVKINMHINDNNQIGKNVAEHLQPLAEADRDVVIATNL